MNIRFVTFILLLLSICTSCRNKETHTIEDNSTDVYTNPLLDFGPDPYAILYEGKYIYTQNCENKIVLWETDDLTNLRNARTQTIWDVSNRNDIYHIWAPELHRINGKWYIYCSFDDGHVDNQRIYVFENNAESPMEGEFVMKGRIMTDKEDNWSIQPTVFQHRNRWYMLWCGRPDHRTDRILQNIYIAVMENPWTLSTERVVLSSPQYEWERQWISPDGNKQDRPAFINEAPQFLCSPNGEKLFIFFSASGSWTPYFCVGLLEANADADLLDPDSWKKWPEPVFMQNPDENVYGPGGISFVPTPNKKESYFLYFARTIPNDESGAQDTRSPRLQKLSWDKNGMPVLPRPVGVGKTLPK